MRKLFFRKKKKFYVLFFLKREIFEKEIFLSDDSNISMNMPQNVDEMSAMDKTSMNMRQNVEEMCAMDKMSMNSTTNPGENTSSSNKIAPGATPRA